MASEEGQLRLLGVMQPNSWSKPPVLLDTRVVFDRDGNFESASEELIRVTAKKIGRTANHVAGVFDFSAGTVPPMQGVLMLLPNNIGVVTSYHPEYDGWQTCRAELTVPESPES